MASYLRPLIITDFFFYCTFVSWLQAWGTAIALVLIFLLPSRTHASQPGQHVIIVDIIVDVHKQHEYSLVLTGQLVAELAAMDVKTSIQQMDALNPAALEALARQDLVGAVIVVDAEGPIVEVWAVDPRTHGLTVKEIPDPSASVTNPERIIALRAIEMLRVVLGETATVVQGPTTTVDAQQSTSAIAQISPPRFGVGIGPALAWSVGWPKPQFYLATRAFVKIVGRLDGGFSVELPTAGTQFFDLEGSATVDTYFATFAMVLNLLSPEKRIFLPLEVGGGIAVSSIKGNAGLPYEGVENMLLSGVLKLGLGIGVAITSYFLVSLRYTMGMLVPEHRISFTERTVAEFGRLYMMGALAFTLTIP